jgi:hypothetical protein
MSMQIKEMKISEIELYKDIPGYEGYYQAYNYGNIKSLKSRHNKILVLKNGVDNCGYNIVTLCKDDTKKTKTVHRLVASAFLGNSNLCVNHKDCNKQNNSIDNLEYVTHKQNTIHAILNNRIKFNTTEIAEKKRKKVLMLDPLTNEIQQFISAHSAAKIMGYSRGNISNACRNNTMIYRKYWKYAI